MEDTRKRPGHESGGEELAAKRQRGAAAVEVTDGKADGVGVDEDDVMAWLCIDEHYTVGELMETEEATASSEAMKVRFIEHPYSSTPIYQSSSSYVTINGNEESCGSSFSDSESSVMASIDTGGVRLASGTAEDEVEGWLERWAAEMVEEGEGAWGTIARGCKEEAVMAMEISGSGCDSDWNDDLLARFLGEEEAQYCNENVSK